MFDLTWPVLWAAAALPALTYWLYWRWSHRRLLQLAALLPGPPALPIIGNALIFMTKPEEQLRVISDMMRQYGDIFRFWLGSDLNVWVINPDDVRLLLTSGKVNKKGPSYKYMTALIGPGLLTGGPTWRRNRKVVNMAFNKKSMQNFGAALNKEGAKLAEVLSKKDPEVTFNVYFDSVHSTTPSVCQTLMGLTEQESRNVNRMDELVLQGHNLYTFLFDNMTHWWYQIPPIYWLCGRKSTERYALKLIDDVTSDILSKRRRTLENTIVDQDSMCVMDRLLQGGLTDQEIKWETISLFTASQEAAAKIISTMFLILAYLPEWQVSQELMEKWIHNYRFNAKIVALVKAIRGLAITHGEKVYNEIIEVIGTHDTFVTEEHLSKLENLDMVFKEAIRLMPIGAYTQRTVEEEISINNGKVTLPVGTSLTLSFYDVQRDPRYWEEPNKPMPERFLPENTKNRNPTAYAPFSLGGMDCLGRVYSMVLIKTLAVHVVKRVELEADGKFEDLELVVAISVKVAKGYNLRARPRLAGAHNINK